MNFPLINFLSSLFRSADCSQSPCLCLLLHPYTGSGIFWQEQDRGAYQPPLSWHNRGRPLGHRQPVRWPESCRPGSCRCQYDGEYATQSDPLWLDRTGLNGIKGHHLWLEINVLVIVLLMKMKYFWHDYWNTYLSSLKIIIFPKCVYFFLSNLIVRNVILI